MPYTVLAFSNTFTFFTNKNSRYIATTRGTAPYGTVLLLFCLVMLFNQYC
nr:MAG TPA: hypothetical protein [Caudoviricetes sp.]